ncbi:helix-turn-helix domain-containing protein, partial [Caballeronia sp.]|uniref:helix-turn-helix domain-containing protein n=1 Tax=Caballeronia sp. TaxID=1931223 RepID=UPI003C5E4323
ELRETELAELAGQSASAFSRYFRRHTGVPFVQYVNRLRINLACQLLMSGELTITDICYQVGFNNLSNFNRQFLVLKDMSPSRWRAYQELNAASGTESPDAAHAAEAFG